MRVLNRIQKRAGKAISGGFRLVSGDAYNAELNLLPMGKALRQRRIQALLRIATTPAYHRHMLKRRSHHRNHATHSPLQSAEEEVHLGTGVDPQELEVRLPYAVPPWWTRPNIQIEDTKELALTHHGIHEIAYPCATRIYTDGSGIDGEVGAAAVCLNPEIVRKAYMGKELGCIVPVAELAGLVLALDIILHSISLSRDHPESGPRRRMEVYTNNQGALQTLQKPGQSSGQYVVLRILEQLIEVSPMVDIYFYGSHPTRGSPEMNSPIAWPRKLLAGRSN
jgi:hypothetical protein